MSKQCVRAQGKSLTDTELLNAIRDRHLVIGFDSADDPWARHHICVKWEDEDMEFCLKSRLSAKFRGPVNDCITAAWLADTTGLDTKSRDEIWAPDFLAARGYASQGFLSASSPEGETR